MRLFRNLDALEGRDDILNHVLHINGDTVIETDTATTLPTGRLTNVEGTRFDFNDPQAIGAQFAEPGKHFPSRILHSAHVSYTWLDNTGYNHCWIFSTSKSSESAPSLSMWSPASGIRSVHACFSPQTKSNSFLYADLISGQINQPSWSTLRIT